jgi:hypothetical protein
MFYPPRAAAIPTHTPVARPVWATADRLEAGLTGFMIALRAAYFLLMWLVTAYEAAMMAGVPVLYPAIRSGLMPPDAAFVLYETAARGHVYLLPAVVWFLIYQGLPALARR